MIMAASEHQMQDWKYENKLLEKFLRPTETKRQKWNYEVWNQ